MSGSYRSSQPAGNNDEYWIYLPNNISDHFHPPRTSLLNPRERARVSWRLFEERAIGGPSNYGIASTFLPAITPRRPSVPMLLINEDYGTYPTYNNYQQPQYNNLEEEEPRLSPEEQKQALNKLSKQLYSPHLNRIIKRLGTGPTRSSNDDEDGKSCAVCLEDFDTKQFVTITPCNHMFHEDCIVPWVKSHGKCPVCRFLIAAKDRLNVQQR